MADAGVNFSKAPEPSSVDPVTQASLPSWESFIEQALNDYESPLIGYATTLLHDTDLARDVVQDVFLRLCGQDRAKVEENLKSWLFTVCRNRAFDVLRKNKRSQRIDEVRWKKIAGPNLPADELIMQQERYAKAIRYLDQLPANQRELIILKFQQNLSYLEIQQITGLKPGNIGFLLHTALTRLRKIIPDDLRH
jgi:RNA polymerase sigma factor (sigma-70 family)